MKEQMRREREIANDLLAALGTRVSETKGLDLDKVTGCEWD